MKTVERKHRRVIECANGKEYENLFEKTMDELAKFSPVVIDKLNAEGHCSYIEWIETYTVPENIRDEYLLQDVRYTCRQCPFYAVNPDGRKRYHDCDRVGHKVYPGDLACLYLYQRVAEGEVTIEGI